VIFFTQTQLLYHCR